MNGSATQDIPLREAASLSAYAARAWVAVGALVVIWFSLAAGRPLTQPDEGRYAEIPREMLLSDDWVTPRLNDLVYLEKPPLQYWATAISYRLLGRSEWSARLWPVLCAALNVVMVFLLGRRLWNVQTGLIAAALLGSMVLHFVMGQLLTLDMAFACALTAVLCSFCMAQLTRDSDVRASGRWMLTSWVMLGVATLTKGLAAPLMGGSVVLLYVLWQRDWAARRTLRPIAGLAVFALIVVPWFVLVARANRDFLEFFFIREHFLRYTTDSAQRLAPWWYFLAILGVGVMPWIWQTFGALFREWRAHEPRGQFDVRRLLWLWCVFVFVFFSLSGSKLAPYILPMFPALALLTAAREASGSGKRLHYGLWILFAGALACVGYVMFAPSKADDPVVRAVIQGAQPAAWMLVLIAALTALLFSRASRRGEPVYAITSLAAGWFVALTVLITAIGHHGSLRSGRDLAARIPADLAAHVPIYSVQTYDQTLPFYLGRTLILVDSRGELDFGLQQEPDKGISDMLVFEQRWRDSAQALAIMSPRSYAELTACELPMRLVGRDRRRVVVSRQ